MATAYVNSTSLLDWQRTLGTAARDGESPCGKALARIRPFLQGLVQPVEQAGAIVLKSRQGQGILVFEISVKRPFGEAGGLGEVDPPVVGDGHAATPPAHEGRATHLRTVVVEDRVGEEHRLVARQRGVQVHRPALGARQVQRAAG